MEEMHDDSRIGISIHAPARGATAPMKKLCIQVCISIHAPARGATPAEGPALEGKGFQSTLPRGERRTKEAVLSPSTIFQSTLPRGERLIRLLSHRRRIDFNPRSREGSDNISIWFKRQINDFNPRSREGSDGKTAQISCAIFSSLHIFSFIIYYYRPFFPLSCPFHNCYSH